MKKLAPFLKLYTEYVKNFDNAMNIINAVAAKHSRFMAIMNDIHVSQSLCLLLQSHTFLGAAGEVIVAGFKLQICAVYRRFGLQQTTYTTVAPYHYSYYYLFSLALQPSTGYGFLVS
jgi:hypothetical protein